MAGSFGFNPDHVGLSRNVAELVLVPEVRKRAAGTLIITNGFSCREQVKHMTGRTAVHLAQVLAMGLPRRDEGAVHAPRSERATSGTIENAL
jgi:hypothetical protein